MPNPFRKDAMKTSMTTPRTARNHRRIAALAIAGTISASLLSACGSSASTAEGASNSSAVTISQAPVLDFGPVWVAQREGFFAKHHITVKLAPPIATGAGGVAALNSHQVDLIAGSPSAMVEASAQGIQTQALVGLSQFPSKEDTDPAAVVVAAGSSISSLTDLAGKTVGVTSLNSQQQSKVMAAIDASGGDSSQTKFIQVPPDSMIGLLKSGKIDAAQPFEPTVTESVDDGTVTVIGYANWQTLGGAPAMTLTTTPEWIKDHSTVARGVRESIDEAVTWMQDPSHKEDLDQILGENTKTSPSLLAKVRMDTFTSQVTAEGLQKIVDNLKAYKMLNGNVDVSSLIGN